MEKLCKTLLLFTCLTLVNSWSYVNSKDWPLQFPGCAGSSQSPINLPGVCDSRVTIDPKLTLEFRDMCLPTNRLDLVNTGHTLALKLRDSIEVVNYQAPSVIFKEETYQFYDLHFHWDENDTRGSDHEIKGKRSAAEIHLVHFNRKYKGATAATGKPEGLLVLAILLRADPLENQVIQPIISRINNVAVPDSTTSLLTSIAVYDVLPPSATSFYSYSGSLTTPPCAEPVAWIVFTERGKIGWDQLQDMERMSGHEDKRRDTQPLNGRPIFLSRDAQCKDGRVVNKSH